MSAAAATASLGMDRESVSGLIRRNGIFVVLAVAVVISLVAVPEFATVDNAKNIARSVSLVGIVALGMTFVVISGNFVDLTVPGTVALSSILVLKLAPDLDLGPGHFKDNGSTFAFSSVGHLILRLGPECTSYSRGTSRAGGLFRGEGFSIGATIGAGTGTLAFDASGSATADVVNDLCSPIGSGTGTMDTSFSLPSCEGRESPPGSRDFVFNCTAPPPLPQQTYTAPACCCFTWSLAAFRLRETRSRTSAARIGADSVVG